MNKFYEFQFKKKNVPYFVDVFANSISEAVSNANTIYNDFILIPDGEDSSQGGKIGRVVLESLVGQDYVKEDIVYVWDCLRKVVIDDHSLVPS